MPKVIAITLLITFVILTVKSFNDQYALIIGLIASVILILFSSEYLGGIFSFVAELIDKSGIDNELIRIIFKITGIGYAVEFSAGIVEDAGLKNMADKLVLVGKIIIISTALPIFYAVFNTFTGFFS